MAEPPQSRRALVVLGATILACCLVVVLMAGPGTPAAEAPRSATGDFDSASFIIISREIPSSQTLDFSNEVSAVIAVSAVSKVCIVSVVV